MVGENRYLHLNYKDEQDSDFLYFGEYLDYNVTICNDEFEFVVEYNYSIGQAFSAFGHISLNKITEDIIKVEYNYGTGSGTTEITLNGKNLLIEDKSN